MPPVLHSRGPTDPQALKAIVAAAATGNTSVEHRRSTQPSASSSLSTTTSSNVRLELDSGVVLTQPNAIARFLAGPAALAPTASPSQEDNWLEWEETTLRPAIAAALRGKGQGEDDQPSLSGALARLAASTSTSSSSFLGGGAKPSLADIAVACTLLPLRKQQGGPLLIPEASSYLERVIAGCPELSEGIATAETENASSSSSSTSTSPSSSTPSCPFHSTALSDALALAPPPLPQRGKRNVLITSALPYVNNVPHLGNIIGCVLSADAFARFSRARGDVALFVCGTDEYGTATETRALEERLSCSQLCDKYYAVHASIYEWFGISCDRFGRTPTWQQTAIAQALFSELDDAGLLQEQSVDQLYSEAAGTFLADRFVEGTCPKCGYGDARGDQCDGCGALLNPTELVGPRCKLTGTAPVTRSTRHVYLDLPALTPDLEAYHAACASGGGWTTNCATTTAAWMRDGLKPRCISRDLRWGTRVPRAGFEDKVLYVWFDAPVGYISITATLTRAWEAWWRPREGVDVELVQFMGKDNVPFHTVIFPATLLGASRAIATKKGEKAKAAPPPSSPPPDPATSPSGNGASDDPAAPSRPWALARAISVTEYLNYEGGKFSKSRGLGVFGDDAVRAGLAPDVWRFYLLSSRPETADTDFKWSDLAARTNAELLANLGNFCHRALSFTAAKLGGVVPASAAEVGSSENDAVVASAVAAASDLSSKVAPITASYLAAMDKAKLREGARLLMSASAAGNKFLQEHAPWELLKKKKKEEQGGEGGDNGNGNGDVGGDTDPGRVAAGVLLRAALGLVALLSAMASPFVPTAAASLRVQLGLDEGGSGSGSGSNGNSKNDPFSSLPPLGEERVAAAAADLGSLLKAGAPLGTPAVLFRAIPAEEVAALRAKFGGAGEEEEGAGGAAKAAAATATAPAAAAGGKKGGKGASASAAAKPAAKPPKKPKTPAEDPNAPVTLSRLDLRVGLVLEARRHPDAEKLYVETIDVGDASGEPRQVVSGLVDHVPLDKFVGSKVVCVCNARPSAMRGQESAAMLLAATATATATGGEETAAAVAAKVEIVSPPAGAKPGARVFVPDGDGEGLSAKPDAEIDLRKSKAWPAIRDELRVNESGVATYKGQALRVEGCGDDEPCVAETIRGGTIG